MDRSLMDTRVFDLAHFLRKFAAIPDEQWCVGRFHSGSAACALGHCGRFSWRDQTPEANALEQLVLAHLRCSVPWITDDCHHHFKQGTAKARILAALTAIRDGTAGNIQPHGD